MKKNHLSVVVNRLSELGYIDSSTGPTGGISIRQKTLDKNIAELPFMEDFPINPRDIRFFGNPIDYIAFTDMGSKKKCAIHFVEVKSGQSNLNNRQKNIKNAILEGKVHWHEYNVDGIWEHETKDQHLNIEKNG